MNFKSKSFVFCYWLRWLSLAIYKILAYFEKLFFSFAVWFREIQLRQLGQGRRFLRLSNLVGAYWFANSELRSVDDLLTVSSILFIVEWQTCGTNWSSHFFIFLQLIMHALRLLAQLSGLCWSILTFCGQMGFAIDSFMLSWEANDLKTPSLCISCSFFLLLSIQPIIAHKFAWYRSPAFLSRH